MVELEGINALIIDGRNLVWRNQHANSKLSVDTDEGTVATGGICGFIESILSVLKRLPKTTDVFVAWEGSKRHRVAVLPDYKLRKPDPKFEAMAEDVNEAVVWLKKILAASGWSQATAPEWEADDVMGTLSLTLNNMGDNVAILSNDRDMLQCLRDSRGDQGWTRQIVPMKGVLVVWDLAVLREEWDVRPDQVVLVKALSGDASDCYKGVPGIGQVWGCRVAREYDATTIAEVASKAKADNAVCGSKKKADALFEHLDYVLDCEKVALVQTNVRVDLTFGDPDPDEIDRIFRLLKFRSLLTNRRAMRRLLS